MLFVPGVVGQMHMTCEENVFTEESIQQFGIVHE